MFKTAIEIPTVNRPRRNAARWRSSSPTSSKPPAPRQRHSCRAIRTRFPATRQGADRPLALAGTPTQKPILILGHMDVVDAKRADWTYDPFILRRGGWLFPRPRHRRHEERRRRHRPWRAVKLMSAGFKPNRDIIFLFYSGDEETQGKGAELGASEWRKLTEAEFGLNADGGCGAFTRDSSRSGCGISDRREDVPDLSLHDPQSGRAQLAAASRQCDLRARRCAEGASGPSLHADAQRHQPRSISRSGEAGRRQRAGKAMRALACQSGRRGCRRRDRGQPARSRTTRTRCVATHA